MSFSPLSRGFTDKWNTLGPIALIGRQGAHCGNIQVASGKCWVSEHALRCLPEKEHDVSFLRYALQSLFLGQYSVSAAQPGLSTDNLKPLLIPFPPLGIQKRTAAFLDEKTAQIDALIAKKRALLDRLAEKRRAIITQAVTKGLDASAPMKDSGNEWIGQVPAHWEVLPLRRVARSVTTGRTPPAAAGDFFTDGTIPWFTPGDIHGGVILHAAEKHLTEDAFAEGFATKYPSHSVLLVGIGATLGKVGVSVAACSSNQQINAITASEGNDPHFLALFLQAFRDKIRTSASGNTILILNQDKTKSILILRPTENEQREITARIAVNDREIDSISTQVQASIDLLAEQRASLIDTAITGQISGLQ